MVECIIYMIKLLIFTLVGGYVINEAIKAFKRGSYYIFGLDLLLGIYEAALIVKLVWTW